MTRRLIRDDQINSTKFTSWIAAISRPDPEFKTFGRAFVRVRSRLAPDGILYMSVNSIHHSPDVFHSDPAWASEVFDFNAGNYCLDNSGTSTECADVSFYQLNLRHEGAANTVSAAPNQTTAALGGVSPAETGTDDSTSN